MYTHVTDLRKLGLNVDLFVDELGSGLTHSKDALCNGDSGITLCVVQLCVLHHVHVHIQDDAIQRIPHTYQGMYA